MPSVTHSLGSFTFINMTPVPPRKRKRLMVESRAGVDGVAVWLDAERGQIYRPQTVVDVESHAAAQTLKDSYEAACGGDPVQLTYADVVYPDVVIMDVEVRIVDQVLGIGGINETVKALVYATWDLIIL